MLLESGLAYELRGVRELEAGSFASAAEYFRRGLELTPGNTPLRRSLEHKLATALFAAGQEDEAVRHLREVVSAAPAGVVDEASGKAAYSLGVIMLSRRNAGEAIEHLQASVVHQPAYVEARIALAETLRRTGRVQDSLPQYREALRLDPKAVQARWGHALALVRLERYRDAVESLDAASASHPDRPEFPHLLARVLAASPDPDVRDGERALALVDELLKGQKTAELGETLAMALAELGDYQQAAAIQRGVLDTVQRAGRTEDARRLEVNLRAYERRQPLRVVWMGESSSDDR